MGDHIISHYDPAIHEASEQGHLSSEGRCEFNFQRDPWQILAAAVFHEPSHPDWRIDFKPDFASAVGHQQHGAKPEEFIEYVYKVRVRRFRDYFRPIFDLNCRGHIRRLILPLQFKVEKRLKRTQKSTEPYIANTLLNKLKLRHAYGTASKVQNQRPVPVAR
jgi:hypothetical protein